MVKPKVLILLACAACTLIGLPLIAQQSDLQSALDPQLQGLERMLASQRAEILANVVTPCKQRVETLINPEEAHQKSCDCFATEGDRQESLANLRRVKQQALARCDLKGLDAQIAYIDQREAILRASLREMIRKFQAQASGFESWGADAEKGEKEAQDKIGQVLVSNALGAMVDNLLEADEKDLTRRLDEMAQHAGSLRDVRRVRTGDLKEAVLALKKELAGKSKAEAKQIVLRELSSARLAVADVTQVEKRIGKSIIDSSIPRDEEPSAEQKTQSYLEGDYATLLTVVKIANNEGLKDVKIFAKAAGVLAFAPDAIDTAAILYNATAIGNNLDGLDQLRAAAERQRATLSAELRALVAQRRTVSAERNSIAQSAKP